MTAAAVAPSRPFSTVFSAVLAAALVAGCAGTTDKPAMAERLYVFNCGESVTNDVSRWSPGVNVGQSREFSANCYLIRHAKGTLMWDSGYADAVAAMPDGLVTAGGASRARRTTTLASDLKTIGVAPDSITYVAFSHFHGDHVGNAGMFGKSILLIQETEYDAAFGPTPQKYGFQLPVYEKLKGNPVRKLNGDYDVFGDGSVVILSTPGHTPGHQSLLVRLQKTGVVILSGDMVHFEENWTNRRVPGMNFNPDQTVKSMDRVAALLASNNGQLLINHDKAQSARMPKAPAYLD